MFCKVARAFFLCSMQGSMSASGCVRWSRLTRIAAFRNAARNSWYSLRYNDVEFAPSFMRLTFLPLLAISSFLLSAANLTKAETGIPMQVCTPISTEDCATSPHWLKPPAMKLSSKWKGQQIEGVVGLNLTVGADGSARDIEVVKSSDDDLKEAVLASAKNWRFDPATFRGQAAAVEMRLVVRFHPIGDPIISLGPWRESWVDPAELQNLFVEANQALGRRDYQQAIDLSRKLIALEAGPWLSCSNTRTQRRCSRRRSNSNRKAHSPTTLSAGPISAITSTTKRSRSTRSRSGPHLLGCGMANRSNSNEGRPPGTDL
jgi:TonB family protein